LPSTYLTSGSQWSRDIRINNQGDNPDGATPGGIAAARIRTEVSKYILDQNGSIPATSKIVTRVFCNYSGKGSGAWQWQKMASRGVAGLAEFAMQFTEKFPLFDYFDAGRGKERADEKIRGTCHAGSVQVGWKY
jgi:hypothetical protein